MLVFISLIQTSTVRIKSCLPFFPSQLKHHMHLNSHASDPKMNCSIQAKLFFCLLYFLRYHRHKNNFSPAETLTDALDKLPTNLIYRYPMHTSYKSFVRSLHNTYVPLSVFFFLFNIKKIYIPSITWVLLNNKAELLTIIEAIPR